MLHEKEFYYELWISADKWIKENTDITDTSYYDYKENLRNLYAPESVNSMNSDFSTDMPVMDPQAEAYEEFWSRTTRKSQKNSVKASMRNSINE